MKISNVFVVIVAYLALISLVQAQVATNTTDFIPVATNTTDFIPIATNTTNSIATSTATVTTTGAVQGTKCTGGGPCCKNNVVQVGADCRINQGSPIAPCGLTIPRCNALGDCNTATYKALGAKCQKFGKKPRTKKLTTAQKIARCIRKLGRRFRKRCARRAPRQQVIVKDVGPGRCFGPLSLERLAARGIIARNQVARSCFTPKESYSTRVRLVKAGVLSKKYLKGKGGAYRG
jgi:hypothetical protein